MCFNFWEGFLIIIMLFALHLLLVLHLAPPGMYGYNDYTTPLWSCIIQTLIMPLPSSSSQWVTPHHMHMLHWPIRPFCMTHGYFGQMSAQVQGTKVWVYSSSHPSSLQKNPVIQMCWKWFQSKLLWSSVFLIWGGQGVRDCWDPSMPLGNYFAWCARYACG